MPRPKGSKNAVRTKKANIDYAAVVAEKTTAKEQIEAEIVALSDNISALKDQLKSKKSALKVAAKELSKAEAKKAAAEKKAEPLVPVSGAFAAKPVADAEKVKREIVFAEGSSELDELSKKKIDAIIASFDNAGANKIAIMAYNYDNGQDVFRKKRQSLNRAIEIRSYLLAKGYKNFSIKVINITDDAARGNVVEIDEIK